MNIKEYIYDKVYDIVAYHDKYAVEGIVENFWKEVIQQEISLDELDEHLKRFCIELDKYWSEED